MPDQRKIDLLKIASSEESTELEERLGEGEAVVSEAPFPKAFLASGNVMAAPAMIRVPAEDPR